MTVDLNDFEQWGPRRRTITRVGNASVTVLFGDVIIDYLMDLTEQFPLVVGCVAWFTHQDILLSMSHMKGVSIIVQKEDFLHPDGVKKTRLQQLYELLPSLSRRDFPILQHMSRGSDDTIEPVRCMGIADRDYHPRMHHKFLVFCDRMPNHMVHPRVLWTGSFNITNTATRSLENVMVIHNESAAGAYFDEYQWVAGMSEPLDWDSKHVLPEWRFGA